MIIVLPVWPCQRKQQAYQTRYKSFWWLARILPPKV